MGTDAWEDLGTNPVHKAGPASMPREKRMAELHLMVHEGVLH